MTEMQHRATHNWQPGKGMKTVIGILFLFVSTMNVASAEDYWFALDSEWPVPADAVHYPTAGAACQKAYADDAAGLEGVDGEKILAYVPPTAKPGDTIESYTCDQNWAYESFDGSGAWITDHIPHWITIQGDSCEDGLVFDSLVGQCETLSDFNNRRQMGDPNNDPNAPCDQVGNPINMAIGNKFQIETDYVDVDGELRFGRFYNGQRGKWSHSYGAILVDSTTSVEITFEDGRTSLFTVAGTVISPEPSERGTLAKSGTNWVYSSPDNQTLTFNSQGQLTTITSAQRLSQTLTYGYDANFNNAVTVKDSRGHTLVFTTDPSGQIAALTAAGVSATYTFADSGQLTLVSRTLAGKTVSRSYLYEDELRPALLTGIIDERGVRAVTWSYDSQGRAVSSEHAGGADKTTIAYTDDGTTTVTNALGHVVTYKYAVVAGTKRLMTVQGEPAPGCPISNSSFTYDARGQIATHTDGLGHIAALVYDTQGRLTTKTEAQGTPLERITTTTWDGTSFRPRTVTTPDRVTTFSYDTKGRPTGTTVAARSN
jgi:YD repeat-containing protein